MKLRLFTACLLFMNPISTIDAKPRPTVDNPNGDTCFNDPATDKNCGGSTDVGDICYCCYDDGCWICGTTPLPGDECVWDPAYRPAGKSGKIDSLTIHPGHPGQRLNKAPRMTPLEEPLLTPSR